jgi:hypothetical protein
MGQLRKRRLPAKSADGDHTLAVLRNSVVSGIDFTHMNAIARRDERNQQVKDVPALFSGKEPFHVFKDESARLFPRYDPSKTSDQGVAIVLRPSHPGR